MTEWTETYRGIVSPWECDVAEHFTIAYYLDRLSVASALFGKAERVGELAEGESRPGRIDLRFLKELRAGSSFHILSGALAVGERELSLAHRFVDSASGENVTWVEERVSLPALGRELRERLGGRLVSWEGPALEERARPKGIEGFLPAARDLVRVGDVDQKGGLTAAGFIHRFTGALLQVLAALGLGADYMDEERRAFSTFELKLEILRVPRLGEGIFVETGILHLGSSSLRFLHRMRSGERGEELARLSQFGVELDLDARRPAPWPEEFRAKAARLLVPVED